MKAKLVTMQLGTQYTDDVGETHVISFNRIRNHIKDVTCKALAHFNGGYILHRETETVENAGYSELVHVIEFILPVTDDFMDVINGIIAEYIKAFKQESVVTTIIDCEALL